MTRYLARLPAHLFSAAYRAGEDFSWLRMDALNVIEFLTATDVAVVGCDVWLATSPGPTIPQPYVYTWASRNRHMTEKWSAFVKSANSGASEYVRSFEWDKRDIGVISKKPFFNLTLADESEYDRAFC